VDRHNATQNLLGDPVARLDGEHSNEVPARDIAVTHFLKRRSPTASVAIVATSDRAAEPGLAFRPERFGGSAALHAAIGAQDREVPLIAANQPDCFGCFASAGLQERGHQVLRPACERAGKTLEPAS
jgi:hypothetical protein